jgi:hypothetical protein
MDDSELSCQSSSLEAAIDGMKKYAEHLEARRPPPRAQRHTPRARSYVAATTEKRELKRDSAARAPG